MTHSYPPESGKHHQGLSMVATPSYPTEGYKVITPVDLKHIKSSFHWIFRIIQRKFDLCTFIETEEELRQELYRAIESLRDTIVHVLEVHRRTANALRSTPSNGPLNLPILLQPAKDCIQSVNTNLVTVTLRIQKQRNNLMRGFNAPEGRVGALGNMPVGLGFIFGPAVGVLVRILGFEAEKRTPVMRTTTEAALMNIDGQFQNLAKVLRGLDAYWESMHGSNIISRAEAVVEGDADTLARVVNYLDQHVDDCLELASAIEAGMALRATIVLPTAVELGEERG